MSACSNEQLNALLKMETQKLEKLCTSTYAYLAEHQDKLSQWQYKTIFSNVMDEGSTGVEIIRKRLDDIRAAGGDQALVTCFAEIDHNTSRFLKLMEHLQELTIASTVLH